MMTVSSCKPSIISPCTAYVACTVQRIWQMEQRMVAVLAAQPHGAIRGVLPDPGGTQPDGSLGPVLRQHNSARPRFDRRSKRGQQHQEFGRSRGGFSTKIYRKTDLDGNPLDFHLTGGEASGSTQFETSLDIGPDIRPRIAMTDKGYDSQANRAGHSPAASHRLSRTEKTPRREDAFFRNASISSGRASNRQSASSSASRAAPCAARRPTSATQRSSVLHAGRCWLNPSTRPRVRRS
jgi:hypothetical protein